MPLHQIQPETSTPGGELRYDTETLRKVTVLAQELKRRHEETFSPKEVEAIGAEVGVEPVFVREAMRRLAGPPVEKTAPAVTPHAAQAFMAAWWSAGWVIPFVLPWLFERLGVDSHPIGFFLGWAIYIGFGVFGSTLLEGKKSVRTGKSGKRRKKREQARGELSRQDLVEVLMTLQRQLESRRERRVFLSIGVVDAPEMRAGADVGSVEASFGQYQAWVDGVVTALGGEIQATAADDTLVVFRSDADAFRAARRVQESMAPFNTQRNRLATPFRVRCGLTSGDLPIDPAPQGGGSGITFSDRATALQRQAAPGDIVLSGELAQSALLELGPIGPHPDSEPGTPVFSWQAARHG